MTEKLYYKDAYISSFQAEVIFVGHDERGPYAILDRTAFFPEEGGQSSDTGHIGNARVVDVREKCGEIRHYTEAEASIGSADCAIDYDARFEKMQCHTAEHILCGIIHKLFGYENVGFHLGDDVVTFDVDGELSAEDIERVELLANEAVYSNREIKCTFPSPDELDGLAYRSKLDIREGVRIVEIDGIDMCACCPPHVASTGEIGIIKIIDYMRHRGGMRFFMVAGRRALRDYTKRYTITRAIGAMTSTPSLDVLSSVEELSRTNARLESELSTAKLALARKMAEDVSETEGNGVYILEDASMDEMREFANIAVTRVGGLLVVLSKVGSEYRYLIRSSSVNLREVAKDINSTLLGKGGGRPEMISGSFSADLDTIRAYFEK